MIVVLSLRASGLMAMEVMSLEERANNGDAEAMYKLAEQNLQIISTNSASSRNVESGNSGFYWYKKAYENGSIEAIEKLGTCYNNGLGTKRDKDKAIALYEEGWQKGSPSALLALCNAKTPIRYSHSDDTLEEPNEPAFLALVKLAKERDDLEPIFYEYIAKQYITSKNKEVIYFLEKGINTPNQSNINSSHSRGFCHLVLASFYANGTYVEKDENKAKDLLKDIAKQYIIYGDAYTFLAHKLAMIELEKSTDFLSVARIYDPSYRTFPYEQYIFESNYDKATEYYKKSAELNNLDAKSSLINIYKSTNPKKALEMAISTLNNSKERNINSAMQYGQLAFYVATSYMEGILIEKDTKKAVEYYEKSVEYMDRQSALELAKIYFYGKVLEQDYDKALKYLLVAEKNFFDTELFEMLGTIYENGTKNTPKDLKKALEYYRKQLSCIAPINLIEKVKVGHHIRKLEGLLEKE